MKKLFLFALLLTLSVGAIAQTRMIIDRPAEDRFILDLRSVSELDEATRNGLMLMPATGTELRGSVPMNMIGDIEFSSEHHLFMPVIRNPRFVFDLNPLLMKRIMLRPSFLSKAAELDDNTYVIRDKAGNEQKRTLTQEYSSWNVRKSSSTEGEKVLEVSLEDADADGGTQGGGFIEFPFRGRSFPGILEMSHIDLIEEIYYSEEANCHFFTLKDPALSFSSPDNELFTKAGYGNLHNLFHAIMRVLPKHAHSRASEADGGDEYDGDIECTFSFTFEQMHYDQETNTESVEGEYTIYGKAIVPKHIPTITSFELETQEDYVKVGNSIVVDLKQYYEEEATWDWNDVEMVGNAYSYEEVDNGVDGGFFSWDPATHSLTSLKSAGKENFVIVKFALKSKPSVKAYITLWTHEGWKYTSFKVGPEEQEVSPGYGCSFYISSEFTPKDSEDEEFDATAIEIDPESDPDDNFHYYDWNNQYSPRLVVYRSDAAPGEYTLRFRLKSDHSIGCTMKVTIKQEE